MASFPQSNRTYQILDAASRVVTPYNDDGVMAVIRAAEAAKSPAIIQVFPWTLKFQGPHFIRYVIEAAHSASIPIAVHLDHCIEPDDVEAALELPFDSIMVDASIHEPAENIRRCKEIVQRANAKNIAIEADMGRIEGGEDGLPTVDLDTILTQPHEALDYGPGGPEAFWKLPLLMDVHKSIPDIPLVLHGTHGVSDGQFRKTRAYGMVKVNLNRTVRDEYTKFVTDNAGRLELTVLKMEAVEVYQASIERVMRDVLYSAGKAS
ncbi:hypothetical protein CEP52_016461 [Fusarium oligoseptatum]|uniref:Fructose-bisphosphate aldolase n=1 Tax=Fusarium oligoseptatum TaxID=2604345 RepID=A0A428S3L6_9HYPO|nr:hypothetical protein CEP52_016461 [Fusarium oligoseptatum]